MGLLDITKVFHEALDKVVVEYLPETVDHPLQTSQLEYKTNKRDGGKTCLVRNLEIGPNFDHDGELILEPGY